MNQNAAMSDSLAAVMPSALATGLFISLCTLQQPSGNTGPSGAPDGTWVDVPGLVNIPCMAPPISSAAITADEVRTLAEVLAFEIKHVLLNRRYPAAEGGAAVGWRAVVDGTNYTLMGAESDSQDVMTRLRIKLESA
jgi:hypothetical protein